MAPAGQMRGPGTSPILIPFCNPNTGPPRSRTLVKPRSSISLAALTAATLMKPASLLIITMGGSVASMRCVWASIRPGISVRPSPLIRVTSIPAGEAMGPVEIARMVLPATNTLLGSDSLLEVPLKTFTFSNTTPRVCAEGEGLSAVPRACALPRPTVKSTPSRRDRKCFIDGSAKKVAPGRKRSIHRKMSEPWSGNGEKYEARLYITMPWGWQAGRRSAALQLFSIGPCTAAGDHPGKAA